MPAKFNNFSDPISSIFEEIGKSLINASKINDPDSPFEENPVDIKTFIKSPEYLNIGSSTYPVVQYDLEQIFTGKYKEAVIVAGIGAGKSAMASMALAYMVYLTLILKDPLGYYQLIPGSTITFTNVSTTATQAKKIVFGRTATLINNSKWFKEHNYSPDSNISSELRFPKNICVFPGSSSEVAPIGYDILGAVMDEAAFMTETKQSAIVGLEEHTHSAAEEIYNSLIRRIESRFVNAAVQGFKGLIFIISSPRWKGDFICKKYEESRNNSEIYSRRRSTFDSKPKSFYIGKRFVVNVEKKEIVLDKDNNPIMTGDTPRYFGDDKNLITVPTEYLKSFQRNMTKALRDICAIPSRAVIPYITNIAYWREIAENSKIQHPFNEDTYRFESWFRGNGLASCIHVDLGTGKEGRDACGIALACRIPNSDKIAIPFMVRLRALETGVDFGKVREIILALRQIGFGIQWITYDGWQSLDSRQQLEKFGFKTEELSVDKTMEPYETFKEAVNTGKVEFYNYLPFIEEIEGLELIEGKRINHSPEGSKDVADAVCGAVFNVMTKSLKAFTSWAG